MGKPRRTRRRLTALAPPWPGRHRIVRAYDSVEGVGGQGFERDFAVGATLATATFVFGRDPICDEWARHDRLATQFGDASWYPHPVAANTKRRARAAASPRVRVIDSAGPPDSPNLDPTALAEFGHLLEAFVGASSQAGFMAGRAGRNGHWRTPDGNEVDYVIEFDDDHVLAFEVRRTNASPAPASRASSQYATLPATGSSPEWH